MVMKTCCCCIGLKKGCYAIGYFTVIPSALWLAINCIRFITLSMNHKLDNFNIFDIIGLLMTILQLFFGSALLRGLNNNRSDEVQLYLCGGLFVFAVTSSVGIVTVVGMLKEIMDAFLWTLVGIIVFDKVVQVYFLIVVWSYYKIMRKEENPNEITMA